MGEDLVSLIIYLALGLIGVIASAYKNKAARKQQMNKPREPQVPRTFQADPKEYDPDLGPLIELFDIPRQQPQAEPEYESVEMGPSVEEAGMSLDSPEYAAEVEGAELDQPVSAVEPKRSDVEIFEEGQSDIQKMIAKYESLRKQLDYDDPENLIARGEIVSVEAEEEAQKESKEEKAYFDIRKAIIYSEILKRKEYFLF